MNLIENYRAAYLNPYPKLDLAKEIKVSLPLIYLVVILLSRELLEVN